MRDVDDLLDEVYSGQERMTRDDIYRRAVAASMPAEVIVALTALPEGEYAQDEVSESLAQIGDVNAERAQGVSGTDLTDDGLLRELWELHRTRHETLRHGSDQALDRHDERTTELEAEYLRRFPDREVDPDRVREGARHREAATIKPVEETQAVELAVGDEAPVPGLAEQGGGTPPVFREPVPAAGPGPRGRTAQGGAARGGAGQGGTSQGGNPRERGRAAARAAGASPDTGAVRTGAEQPWDPEDLAVAQGHDPNERNVSKARQELTQEGPSAIERTVP